MNKIGIFALLFAFSSTVFAESTVNFLKKTNVNHLQLLINNLNMLYVTHMVIKDKGEEEKNEPMEMYANFFESKDGNIVANIFYQAPMLQVTKVICNELIQDQKDDLKTDTMVYAINSLTTYELTLEQSKSILNSIYIQVNLQARENKELSVMCGS